MSGVTRREREHAMRRGQRAERWAGRRRRLPHQVRAFAAFVAALTVGTWVFHTWVAPWVAESQDFRGCDVAYGGGTITPAEIAKSLGWWTDCWDSGLGWATMAGAISVVLIVAWVLGLLAYEWSRNKRPPDWALSMIGFAAGTVIFVGVMTAGWLVWGASFVDEIYDQEDVGKMWLFVGGTLVVAVLVFLGSLRFGRAVSRWFERIYSKRRGAGTGIILSGGATIGIVIATVIAVILAVLAAAVAMIAVMIYAAFVALLWITGIVLVFGTVSVLRN